MATQDAHPSHRLIIRPVSKTQVEIKDLLPSHIRNELQSAKMKLLSAASIKNPQTMPSDRKFEDTPDKITAEEATVFSFGTHSYNRNDHIALMCREIACMLEQEGELAESKAIQVFIQALIFCFGRSILDIGILKTDLRACGVILKEEVLDPSNGDLMRDIRADARTQQMKDVLMGTR